MNITSTHFKILKCLSCECYSFQELVLILGISEFKIRKHIKDLESIFKINGIKNIYTTLKKDSWKISEIKILQSFSSDERETYILLNFLFNETINLSKLSLELDITRRTVANDIVNLKKYLVKFNLDIESFNSIGIKLKGHEINKRQIFELYILKILREERYLPEKLKKLLKKINKIRESDEVYKIVSYILNITELPSSGLALRHIETLISISMIRRKHLDSSITNFKLEDNTNSDINNFLSLFNFCTNYEKYMINHHYNLRNYNNIIIYQTEYIKKIQSLLTIFNENFNSTLLLEKNTIIKLYSVFKSYEFKKTFNIKEFYLFKKNLSEEYLQLFDTVKNIILSSLENIDSFDLMTISSIFIDLLSKDFIININKLKNIVVVYNFINPLIIRDLCLNLGLHESISNFKIIYINHLKYHIKNNPIDFILTFENIELSELEIKHLNFKLPLTSMDKLKLKNILYKPL